MDDFDYVPDINRSLISTSSAAPKLDRDKKDKKTQTPARQMSKGKTPVNLNNAVAALSLIIAAVTVFLMLSGIMFMNTKINEKQKKISSLTTDIAEVQAENIRLNAELSSMVSADKIRNYAVTVLGMQKVERYQVHYFENRAGNSVVIADGKDVTDAVS